MSSLGVFEKVKIMCLKILNFIYLGYEIKIDFFKIVNEF